MNIVDNVYDSFFTVTFTVTYYCYLMMAAFVSGAEIDHTVQSSWYGHHRSRGAQQSQV